MASSRRELGPESALHRPVLARHGDLAGAEGRGVVLDDDVSVVGVDRPAEEVGQLAGVLDLAGHAAAVAIAGVADAGQDRCLPA
jgi:hypothetical protein